MNRKHSELLKIKEEEFAAKEEAYRIEIEQAYDDRFKSREDELAAREAKQKEYEEEQNYHLRTRRKHRIEPIVLPG